MLMKRKIDSEFDSLIKFRIFNPIVLSIFTTININEINDEMPSSLNYFLKCNGDFKKKFRVEIAKSLKISKKKKNNSYFLDRQNFDITAEIAEGNKLIDIIHNTKIPFRIFAKLLGEDISPDYIISEADSNLIRDFYKDRLKNNTHKSTNNNQKRKGKNKSNKKANSDWLNLSNHKGPIRIINIPMGGQSNKN
jgi:hypothetical protein